MTDTTAAVHSAASTAKGAALEFADAAAKYISPLVGGLAGFFGGPKAIGGFNLAVAINDAFSASPQVSGWGTRIGAFVMAGITALIGGVFWSFGRSGHVIKMLVGRFIGGFFLGTAGAYAVMGFTNTEMPSGLIESLAAPVTPGGQP